MCPEILPPSPQAILDWYDLNARQLPWRVHAPVRPDPYHIWLSEVMLQQTTVATVKSYYQDFLKRWPSVIDLAAAPEQDVMAAWAGLGYYARARHLHACAQEVVALYKGQFPETEEELRGLPGIGPYTAAAIAAIAFDQYAVVVDGNIERILSRLFAIATPFPASKGEIRQKGALLTPLMRAGDFAQGMMDLGATICTPQRPSCEICPFEQNCQAHAMGEPSRFPIKAPKKARPVRRGVAFYARRTDGHVLTRIRAKRGLLGGMLEFPSQGWEAQVPVWEGAMDLSTNWRQLSGEVTHIFTHFALHLCVLSAEIEAHVPPPDTYEWTREEELETLALPTLMKKVAEHAQKNGGDDLFVCAGYCVGEESAV